MKIKIWKIWLVYILFWGTAMFPAHYATAGMALVSLVGQIGLMALFFILITLLARK